ncbi:MAG: tyrosine-type recombinase/integrase [Tissierellia bacterium]|nr:tyrosine-type recombinase/integrase [Tissierellia bacterium]
MKRSQSKNVTYGVFFDEFERRCKVKNVSEYTLKFYYNSLKPFEVYLDKCNIKMIKQIDKNIYENYVLHLQNKLNNTVTINTYLRAVKTFLRYAMECNYIDEFKIAIIKPDDYVKETYSDEDIKKLIKKPNLKTCSFVEYRNWVLVQYLLETGNRVNTLIRIKVGDVDLEDGMVLLNITKSHKQMYFPISKTMINILLNYLDAFEFCSDDWLFPNSEKGQLSRGLAAKSIARYNKQCGVNITSLHAFRHTFAKNYIMNGGNAFKLQRLLGHSTLNVTQMYIRLFGTDLKEDFEKYSIVEKYYCNNKMKRKS